MKSDVILIRYGELALKSPYVRHVFEATLLKNIKQACAVSAVSCQLSKEKGRIYLKTDTIQKACSVLQRIFGIVSFSPAQTTPSTMDSLKKAAAAICSKILTAQNSFALRVTRTGTHEYTSQDVAVEVGKDIVATFGATVDLTSPDFELFIEVRQDTAYLFLEKIKGVGGLPLGTQGMVLAFIENEYSLLASWYLLKRGCQAVFLVTDASLHSEVQQFKKHWYLSSEVLSLAKEPSHFFEHINTIAQNKNCDAVCFGTSLADTSCDVLSHLHHYKKHIAVPLLLPLIAFERKEIEAQWKQLGGMQ